MSKRPLDDGDEVPRNETGKVVFVRDAQGELITVRPGEALPAKAKAATDEARDVVAEADAAREQARLAARSEEDVQYEAYLGGRDAKKGNVWIAGAGVASADKAAAADSISAQIAEEQRASGKEYAPSRAHDRSAKMKKASHAAAGGGGSYGGSLSVTAARAGAEAAAAALAKAREASDDDEDDDLSASAAALAERSLRVYNLPISNLPQLDPYGNDLRVPLLERKTRKFLECFGEEAHVTTLEGQAVLKDFEALRKRYGTVFRESGAGLSATALKRFLFSEGGAEEKEDEDEEEEDEEEEEEDDDGSSFCLAFERHESLVTPRVALDGSLGCHPPRTQDLIVLYRAAGGELTGMYIAPDKDGLGADAQITQAALEATDAVKAFRRLVAKLSGGRRFTCKLEG